MSIEKYMDMLDMPYEKSKKRPHMSMANRAAQFAPFAALTGFEDQVQKKAVLNADEMNNLTKGDLYEDD